MKEEKNVIFVGEGEAPAHINTPRETIELPDSATQKKGFYSERAGFLRAHFPKLYKEFKKKGK